MKLDEAIFNCGLSMMTMMGNAQSKNAEAYLLSVEHFKSDCTHLAEALDRTNPLPGLTGPDNAT